MLALFGRIVTEEIARYGYVAIFVLMFLESACVPIPSEVTMLFGGALVSTPVLAPEQRLSFVAVALIGALANLVGSWVAFWVGYAGGRPLIDRWGRYLLLRPHEIDRAHDWFERYGQAAVFFGRLLPVIRTFISLPAGVARMRLSTFTLYTLLGCLPWTFGLTFLGYKLGESWNSVERLIQPVSWLIAAAIAAGVGWWVWRRVRDVRARPVASPPTRSSASGATPPGSSSGRPEEEPISRG
ncbi:MAG TPA: DedA family protein [Actinomycetota bacterium]|nr:DedA family protein [Actinomycetota bacterium]